MGEGQRSAPPGESPMRSLPRLGKSRIAFFSTFISINSVTLKRGNTFSAMRKRPNEYVGPLLVLGLCVAFSLRCADDSVAPGPVPSDRVCASRVIGPDGGAVTLGRARVVIPPGALDYSLEISICEVPSPPNPPANHTLASIGYSFEPYHYEFKESVTVYIDYDTSTAHPSLGRLDNDFDVRWEFVGGTACSDGVAAWKGRMLGIYAVTDFLALKEVYVSTRSKGVNAAGTRDDPLPTISAGINASVGAGTPYPSVYAATGTYQDNISLVSGVSVYGGYDGASWEPVVGARSVVALGTAAVYGEDITDTTRITNIDFRRGDASAPSANSVALHLVSCGEQLQFEGCRFEAGNGADGSKGSDGGDGGRGASGGSASDVKGGAGGAGCNAGGKGGDGAWMIGGNGEAGEGPNAGSGGGGTIVVIVVTVRDAQVGGNGGFGSPGPHGFGGSSTGAATRDGWIPSSGANGTAGTCGSGGGGGGGAASYIGPGGGGGGGGGGGHGGGGGQGGRGGGSSLAVYLFESKPVFTNCEFVAGAGGTGGSGGNGGSGGSGGDGGICDISWGQELGAKGGKGGWGGNGGGGQGGPGGLSYCIYRAGSVSYSVTINGGVFTAGTAGDGGPGGFRGDSQALAGHKGLAGEVGP